MRKAALHNLGCKVNAYETEAMQELLEKDGYEIVSFHEEADVYIINTCSVTNMADRKSRQMIHRAKKKNPQAVIVAAGCYVQTLTDAGKTDENIDIVIGNNKKNELTRILDNYFSEREGDSLKEVIDINHTTEYESLHVSHPAGHTRAYLKVQDGCNQFCSYCVIPYARGRVRSREKEDIIQEVKVLAQNGTQEVVLTGIHLSSYGVDFKGTDGEQTENLLSLICAVNEIDGIKRIRLGSLEPRIVTEEFAKVLSEMPKICPHFHLSLQSGCDDTLHRMNRRYDSTEYLEKCELLRKYFKNPALTTDVIVGFPGETEEEFEQSKAFLERVEFYETHIFKYSKRQGTRAAEMDNQVPEEVKTKRSGILQELNLKNQKKYEALWMNQDVEVLFEETIERDGKKYETGHTKEYIRVAVPSEESWENKMRYIKIVNYSQIIH